MAPLLLGENRTVTVQHPDGSTSSLTGRHVLLAAGSVPRTIPGFEPSPESYALALDVVERTRAVLAAAGAGRPRDVDLFTALVTGLASQQVSNDPGGRRWRRLTDDAVAMFLAARAA